MRTLVLVLGDQLDLESSAFDGFDPGVDAVWMAEVAEESTHVWSSKVRTVMFLAAMRHFAQALTDAGRTVHYTRLEDPHNPQSLAACLRADILRLRPGRLVLTAPGDWRVLMALKAVAKDSRLPLELRDDRHFYGTVRDFAAHARAHQPLRMEYFYREMRQRHGVLMEDGHPDRPLGGQWNFDAENRHAFSADGPGFLPPRASFEADEVTREVIEQVEQRFPDHPGQTAAFAWPVTRAQALVALQVFIAERLPLFGHYQDAMWPGDPWLYHAQLSAALNLKLLNPREVVRAAVEAFRAGQAPLASVEGFVRQILGWREYVRGVYWTRMPEYLDRNALGADQDLPDWYWTGRVEMACLRDTLTQTLTHGYAHHIQRLMVTGLYALLLGVQPRQVHAWYLAVYVDAVEWVELPNTLGMSQFADGGEMASKPYIATGRYIDRMGPYCRQCRYRPEQRTGPDACPFTTLYWDFLIRHEEAMSRQPRMAAQALGVARLGPDERREVTDRAAAIRRGAGPGGGPSAGPA
ncbi:cryptochrome/photolyase family protein [Xylophilus sp. Kf1]|nr:cryptochrome/photolyase family protein [Xylophilus sp. Kf1]